MIAAELDDLLELALAAALAGGDVLLARQAELQIRTKSEAGDLVTDADVASERAIRAVIAAARPADSITGEELGHQGAASPGSLRWVVDPLDGTTNYVRDIAYWSVSVAVCDQNNVPLAGAVAAPSLGRAYVAAVGRGAWRQDATRAPRRLRVEPDGRSDKALLLGTGLSYRAELRGQQWRTLAGLLPSFTDIRRLGSAALDLCAVAEGGLDAFLESDLAEHDYMAGAVIARESGIDVTDACGAEPSPAGVVAARPALHRVLIGALGA